MLIRFFLLLRAFLTLGADPPDDANPPDGASPEGDPPDDGLPNLEDEDPPEGDPPESDDPAVIREQLKAERTARETAERNHREASDRLAAAERARAAPPAQTDEQKLWEQEEAILNNAASTQEQRYWAQANRTLRESARTSKQALMESREIADKGDWERLKVSSPVLKKYEERVEKKLQEIRSQGQNLPRKLVAQMLIGDDIVSGKVKSTKRGSADPAPPVNRGKPPAARSDVRGRGGQSEQDKRRARLENQIL